MMNALRLTSFQVPTRYFTTLQGPLLFRTTPNLLAEPLKKKKKLDPMIIKHREERRRKRIEKIIRKMEKGEKQLKPIVECEVPEEIYNNRKLHERPLPAIAKELENQRVLLFKKWTTYKIKQQLADIKLCDRLLLSQQFALDQLKNESEELYNAAIQLDENLIPFRSKGPVETPPIKSYDSPDGEYIDVSKKWDN